MMKGEEVECNITRDNNINNIENTEICLYSIKHSSLPARGSYIHSPKHQAIICCVVTRLGGGLLSVEDLSKVVV